MDGRLSSNLNNAPTPKFADAFFLQLCFVRFLRAFVPFVVQGFMDGLQLCLVRFLRAFVCFVVQDFPQGVPMKM